MKHPLEVLSAVNEVSCPFGFCLLYRKCFFSFFPWSLKTVYAVCFSSDSLWWRKVQQTCQDHWWYQRMLQRCESPWQDWIKVGTVYLNCLHSNLKRIIDMVNGLNTPFNDTVYAEWVKYHN